MARVVESGIGVSPEVKDTLKELEKQFFQSEGSAFKACVALAISRELEVVEPNKVDRTWHAGSGMQDLLDFVELLTGTETPARDATVLGHTGLLFVKKQMEADRPFRAIFNSK